jgi:putative redox protein
MKVTIQRKNQAIHFEGLNPDKLKVEIDGSPTEGGEGKGVRPMELVLMALASCSSIDLVLILQKMRQELRDLKIEVEGKRAEEQVPKVFTEIHLYFILMGNIEEDKAARAVKLAVDKYCSVKNNLDPSIKISYDFEIQA